jgi:23S rRNA (guanosine2251-2'-O)-methyltransferase
VSKISSGATEEIRIYRVINLRRSIDMLKESGFWIYGSVTDSEANVKAVGSIEYNFPVAIVFGGEQNGLSRLVRNNCDFLIKINIEQSIQSLNVSVASGIILYTAYLQKSLKN